MLDFVAKAFRTWVTFILWSIIIGFAIVGAMIGGVTRSGGLQFFLFIVGGLIGLITAILFGGFIANFLNMVDNIEKLVKGNKSLLESQGITFPDNPEEKIIKEAVVPEYKEGVLYKVIKETSLKDTRRIAKYNSVAIDINTIRLLNVGERVIISNVTEYEELGKGMWAYIKTQLNHEEGWCLFEDLAQDVPTPNPDYTPASIGQPQQPSSAKSIKCKVIKETNLNDSLSPKPKTYRLLKEGEVVIVTQIQNREELGEKWGLIETEAKESGWCLINALSRLKVT